MESLFGITVTAGAKVVETLAATWPFLLGSVVVAAALRTWVDQQTIARFLFRNRRSGIFAATGVAVGTPLCSCGTTAIVLGMMASMTPWAPIVAFMVASPLTSPQEFLYSAALFGWPFATVFFASSIALGLVGGLLALLLESRGWLAGQNRVAAVTTAVAADADGRSRFSRFRRELLTTGRQLMLFFFAFAFIGYLLNGLVPQAWVSTLFGRGELHSVPLAATLGIPFYFNTEASLPLIRPMLDAGMSPGAALAFLITGAGTSVGAIAGALTIARWRVIALIVGTLWVGGVASGFAWDALQLFSI